MWRKCAIAAEACWQKRDGDSVHPDIVAGVPDSGVAHAIGYANESGIPLCKTLYQIYTYLAQVVYAYESEPE